MTYVTFFENKINFKESTFNPKAVCRTAPLTPGLLASCLINIYNNRIYFCTLSVRKA